MKPAFILCIAFIFCFSAAFPAKTMATEAKAPEYEITYWESVKNSTNPEMFQAYIDQFPDGLFVQLAKIRLKELAGAKPGEAPASTTQTAAPSGRTLPTDIVNLRSTPQKLANSDINDIVQKLKFYEKKRCPACDFANHLIDNGDGTVTDAKTGLMWEKQGSWNKLNMRRVKAYIDDLNRNKFGGRTGWRLPTVEELASLLESKYTERDWLYIDPMFGKDDYGNWLRTCWTSDTRNPDLGYEKGAWVVQFSSGTITTANWNDFERRESGNSSNFVRAVCSLK
jgi:hypothetical protein